MQQYVSRRFVVAFMILVLLLAMVFGLVQCGLERKASRGDSAANAPTEEGSADLAAATPEATPTPKPSKDPYDAVKNYWSESQLTQAGGPDQVVEHRGRSSPRARKRRSPDS